MFGRAPTEAVTRTGSAADQIIRGGDFDDILYGFGGNDRLFGAGGGGTLFDNLGRNRLAGGDGDDTYWVGATSSTIVEYADEGTDTVTAQRSLTLSANVENLTLAGDAAVSLAGNGNALDNALTDHGGFDRLGARAGSDMLDGEAGHDILSGGTEGRCLPLRRSVRVGRLADWQDTTDGPEARPDGLDRIDLSGLDRPNDADGLNDLRILRSGRNVVITLDLDHGGRTDFRDLDGDGAVDATRIVVRKATAGDFDIADFIF